MNDGAVIMTALFDCDFLICALLGCTCMCIKKILTDAIRYPERRIRARVKNIIDFMEDDYEA